ncbi:MAG TPA: hypothetical protein VFC10_04670 [Terriglobia bacterium]|nr:hypothetical protein [Terriglobia bacterium]
MDLHIARGSPRLDTDIVLREAIQRVALEFPSDSFQRMAAELDWFGWGANHKRFYQLTCEVIRSASARGGL